MKKQLRSLFATLLSSSAPRFGIVGVAVTLLHVIVAAGLIETEQASPAIANGIAFIIATVTAFILHARYTFRQRTSLKRFLRFLTVALFCSFLSAAIAGACEHLGWPYQLGILTVILSVTPISFLLHRQWTYA